MDTIKFYELEVRVVNPDSTPVGRALSTQFADVIEKFSGNYYHFSDAYSDAQNLYSLIKRNWTTTELAKFEFRPFNSSQDEGIIMFFIDDSRLLPLDISIRKQTLTIK